MFHAEHDTANQRRHRRIEALDLEAFDAAGLRRTSRIVEQAIDPAEFLHRKGDQRLHLLFHRDVGLAKDASGAELAGQRLALRRAASGDHDLCAFGGEQFCGAPSDAARRTGNHRNLAIQPPHVVPLSPSVGPIFPPLANKASELVPRSPGAERALLPSAAPKSPIFGILGHILDSLIT